ncbi:MAG: glycosyltransferase family 4 protein [Candidatus Moranbacteria bacterium]|nr:glycosyltransferase family 4 protein [Candidatus Moranbacteria bacterium]
MMKIGIDASRAFLKQRTGIEEYSYRVIENLRDKLNGHQVFLYVRKKQEIDFELPENWRVKVIKFPRFWTQLGLSLEMLLHPVDTLLIPAHTVPLIHPKNTIVIVHGLEYEFCPGAYSWFERFYMRLTIKKSCQWASKIISVSENTKKDLINLYKVVGEKISVIYEGYNRNFEFPILNFESNQNNECLKIKTLEIQSKFKIQNSKFLLFVGRIEERKNIGNIIKAFEILKEKYKIPHKLILAGKPGHGYENIKYQITNSKCCEEIKELGFVGEEEKWELLKKADVFVFPTLYEGFGIPILEAQSVGCPVVASNNSSIPEIAQDSAILTNPEKPEEIAESMDRLISNKSLKDDIIAKGLENVRRFSWEKCAQEISEVLLK